MKRSSQSIIQLGKHLLLISILFPISFFVGCTDKDNIEEHIVGTWYDKSSTVAPNEGYVFYANYTGYTFYKNSEWPFVWSFDGKNLSVTHNTASSLDKSSFIDFDDTFYTMSWGEDFYVKDPLLCYYYNSNGSGSGTGSSSGVAPSSLIGKTLNLYKSDNSYWMGIYHNDGSKAIVDLYNDAMVSAAYPPTYHYKVSGSSATYSVTFTTQTYIPYYGAYTYSQFTEEITLTFRTSSSGTYSGNQINMTGGYKSISGNFEIK